jgi:NADH dehydrogenase (ubiquinone) Fe-S protein 1
MFRPVSWEEALFTAAQKLRQVSPEKITAIAGGLCDAESLVALKDLINRLNGENVYTEESYASDNGGADLR